MLEARIDALVTLGQWIAQNPPELEESVRRASQKNPWFTPREIRRALTHIRQYYLHPDKLHQWLQRYPNLGSTDHTLGLVLAGNIPMVGFHDWLCGFVAGYTMQVKLSSKDDVLIPTLVHALYALSPRAPLPKTHWVERLRHFDAIIATGSASSHVYFRYYFRDYPHILRHNRNSVAILSGKESDEEITALGEDIFAYYGMGCRSVSKVYLPSKVDLERYLSLWDAHYGYVMDHPGYLHNYQYNVALAQLSGRAHLRSDTLLVIEESSLASRIASLHYERYKRAEDLPAMLTSHRDHLQLVVHANDIDLSSLPGQKAQPGKAQYPELWDYADGVDTLQHLIKWYELPPTSEQKVQRSA